MFYNACVAAEGNSAIDELKEKMKASGFGDWPITSVNTSYGHWSDVLVKTGMSPVLELRVGRDHFNITDHIIQLTTPPEEKTNFSEIHFTKTVKKLQTDFPGLPLLELLNKEFAKVDIELTEDEILELLALPYYEKLIEFLNISDT